LKRRIIYFTAPRQLELREEELPALSGEEVLVETVCSAISSGSELLVYRGQFPRSLPDEHDAISSALAFPLAYGYSAIGRVRDLGNAVSREWAGRLVFSFQPHTSHFVASTGVLIPVPESLAPEAACFLPSMETAVNFVQDAAPILGERALVLGQGVVGLLTAALMVEFPLQALVTGDRYPLRRKASLELGVAASLDPGAEHFRQQAGAVLGPGADLAVEVSGSPAALDDAVALTRFSGRVLIGSWYGEKRAPIDLGGRFHRSRIRLISSQVSSFAPELSSRWDKARRFAVAWSALGRLHPEKWITHRFALEDALEAYRLLDEDPAAAIQTIFEYS
jgi:2-desacetyl-2-hydroxyethyl bacteriochlorophyllide A dehydrogenase